MFVAGDQAVFDRVIDHGDCPIQLLLGEVLAMGQQISAPLLVDLCSPARPEPPCHRQPDQQIAQRRRIENTSVIDDSEASQSVAHPEFLRLPGQFIHRLAADFVCLLDVVEQILVFDAAVPSDLGEANFACFQQLHQIGP